MPVYHLPNGTFRMWFKQWNHSCSAKSKIQSRVIQIGRFHLKEQKNCAEPSSESQSDWTDSRLNFLDAGYSPHYVYHNDRIAKQIIERKVTDSVNTILLQVNEKMTSFDSDMQGISTFLFYSPTVQTYINAGDILDRVLMNRELLSVFANTMSMKSNIRGIQLDD